ncbi:alkaline shock response membrane anchor protein AmaP [Pseudonocardia sp. NPDC049635]|uniref:alkaline shock response membrane anchor protein AmaP n=1 Tax=Pseudonocardia sp. NPDC049635 TaxID=3155506 RepID=UPI0033C79BA2
MAAANPPARLNRSLLLLIGLVLLVAGAAGLAFGSGALRSLLPGLDPSVPLLPGALDPPAWVPWVTLAAAVVVGLLALRWLLAQARRRPRTTRWGLPAAQVAGRDAGSTRLHSDHAAAALAADVESYDGVQRAAAVLTGDRTRPEVYLDVTAETGADLAALRGLIDDHALPRLRSALGADGARTELVLRLVEAKRAARVG